VAQAAERLTRLAPMAEALVVAVVVLARLPMAAAQEHLLAALI